MGGSVQFLSDWGPRVQATGLAHSAALSIAPELNAGAGVGRLGDGSDPESGKRREPMAEKRLTNEIAEQFLADEDSVDSDPAQGGV